MKLRHRRQEELSLNLTPLIDVVFLLLIFFMVTTTFSQHHQLGIELPEVANNQMVEKRQSIEIGIDAKGAFYLQGVALDSSDKQHLKQALSNIYQKEANTQVTILGDKSAPHQAVVAAMDVAGQLGIHQLRILAERS